MTNEDKMLELLKAAMPELLILKEMIEANDIPIQDVMRALYLLSNVKKVAQWGKVIITIKNGEIVAVSQEQQFISERELNKKR